MKLYMGIDLGWKRFRFEVKNEKNIRLERGGAEATPEGLRKVLSQYASIPMRVAYEAGCQMKWVDRVVKEMKQESYPFHAANFALIVKSIQKTDKKDAEKIAWAALKGLLPERVLVGGEKEQRLRELLQEREARKKDLGRWGNQLHALAISEGFAIEKKPLSQREKNWEEAVNQFHGAAREKAQRLYRLALTAFQALEEIEAAIRAEVNAGEWKAARKRLQTIPGVGFWTAVGLLAWSGVRAARFASGRKAASYFGMVGRLYESGQVSRTGPIAKCGPPVVRRLLIQAAWAFLRSRAGGASRWGVRFKRMVYKRENQKKKAIVALARKLLTAAVACLRNETEWDKNRLALTR